MNENQRAKRNDVLTHAYDMIAGALGSLRDIQAGDPDPTLEDMMLKAIIRHAAILTEWSVLDDDSVDYKYEGWHVEIDAWRSDMIAAGHVLWSKPDSIPK